MIVLFRKFKAPALCHSTCKFVRNISYSHSLRNTEPSQNIFDRQAKRLQKERSAQRPDVALYDYIKDEVGFRLSDRIFDIKREIKNAADIGKEIDKIKLICDSLNHLNHLLRMQ